MKPMGVVPVRLDDEDLKRIDLLVKHQAFRSRNEAIKKMIKTMLSESTADDQDVDKLVESLLKLKKAGKEPLVLRLKQSATEIVASGRDHWPT
jgi:metal-responsive CopG/Arc/MetJ family transcriptional regulator